MKSVVLLIVSCSVSYSMSLECGIAKAKGEDIQQALKICVKNNETLERIWEMSSDSSSSTVKPTDDKDSESDSNEEEVKNTTRSPKSGKNGKLARIKRAKSAMKTQQSVSRQHEKDIEEKDEFNDSDNTEYDNKDSKNNNGSNELSEESTKDSQHNSDECIIHCVLERLNLVDDAGLPDRTKVSEELVKGAKGRELKNFLQESTDECFQDMKEDNDLDSCSYSTKLITCLAERGRSNCADWPAGGLPF